MTTYNIQDSSRITKVVMFEETRSIQITFKGNKTYSYHSVSKFDFDAFKQDIENGESVGKSFEKRIRNKYAGKRLTPEEIHV